MRGLRKYCKLGFILVLILLAIFKISRKNTKPRTQRSVWIQRFVRKVGALRHEEFKPLAYRMRHKYRKHFHHRILPGCAPSNDSKQERISKRHRHGRNEDTVKMYNHGKYIFVKNYATPLLQFECNESITFTTHGEFNFIDNVVPIVERWEGPVTVAIYAPGYDFQEAVRRIHFLRECSSHLVKKLVTFHLFYDELYKTETKIPPPSTLNSIRMSSCKLNISLLPLFGLSEYYLCFSDDFTVHDCVAAPVFGGNLTTFRSLKNLTYPVNVARNFARSSAKTHFVLAADIELYPSLNMIPMFLQMAKRKEALPKHIPRNKSSDDPKVYVPPVFEVASTLPPPDTKSELLKLIKMKKAVPFHVALCSYCHNLPGYNKWLRTKVKPGRVKPSHWTTRKNRFDWEPVFIGTNSDPLYHEELTWEGMRNKMSQVKTRKHIILTVINSV